MFQTPTVLIIFNRPETTGKVFEAIRKVRPRQLLVIADGPRPDRPGEAERCAAARAVLERVDWACEVKTLFSDTNLGCDPRIVSGLDWVFEQVEEAVVFEDDCLPDPSFFPYCAQLLDRFRDEPRIMTICGNNFQFGRRVTDESYYFSRYAHTWGWATWRRTWRKFDFRARAWHELKNTPWLENLLGNRYAAQFWGNIFQKLTEKPTAWDFGMTFATWVHDGLNVVPARTLVTNIGFGEGATHTKDADSTYASMPFFEMSFPLVHPAEIVRHAEADDYTERTIFSRDVGRVFEAFKSRKSGSLK